MDPTPTRLRSTALAAARAAAAVHRQQLGRVRVEDWSEKGVSDFVTFVDREAEERIVELIRARHPGHAFLAEEGTAAAADPGGGAGAAFPDAAAEWLWIIDPLDGTTNYLHSYPMFAASVAVAHRGELVAGAVVCTPTGEEWTAAQGVGAYKDGRRIFVSEIQQLSQSLIGTGFPFKALDHLPEYLLEFEAVVRRTSGVRRAGSAAIDLCHVASGYFDGFWEIGLFPWDVAAGALLVREAGGLVTTIEGDPDVLGGGSVLAGNHAIHAELGALLSSVR